MSFYNKNLYESLNAGLFLAIYEDRLEQVTFFDRSLFPCRRFIWYIEIS